MTYREEIQAIIARLEATWDKSEYLRDCATLPEKPFWNAFRTDLRNAANVLQLLDNTMTDERAEMEI
jgi:hypothetical protein